jgi:hypothetical protein
MAHTYGHSCTLTPPLASRFLIPPLFANPPYVTPSLLTWRASFSSLWCEYPSTLVSGLLSTVHPLLLHPPPDSPQIKLQYLHRRHQQHQSSRLIQELILLLIRVFSQVPFWNSMEYGILYGIYFISRDSAKFFTVQYREIPRNSV